MTKRLSILLLVAGCATTSAPQSSSETATTESATTETFAKRPFEPTINGEVLFEGISYGPYREGQAPGGPYPTAEQVTEDLEIIAKRWNLIRVYGSDPSAETILTVIRERELPIKVMLGAWIAPDFDNDLSTDEAIRFANAFPEQVVAVNVGNESQVSWSGHRTDQAVLMKQLRKVRAAVKQPVTVADDYNYWNKPESKAVAAEVDFLVVHAYAMWNKQKLEDAVAWTEKALASIQEHHPDHLLVLGETGWATDLNPDAGGDQVVQIIAPAGEDEQKRFYEEFTAWAASVKQTYFYFSAFDEPWKGSPDPREVEKHWGLYNVDRSPKKALQGK